jgi:hypothetical protein
MILLVSLSMLYKYLIITLETMLMKESMMECVAMHLRHKLLKCENKESMMKCVALVSRQNKVGDQPL